MPLCSIVSIREHRAIDTSATQQLDGFERMEREIRKQKKKNEMTCYNL